MKEIVKVQKASYAKYEELLLQKSALEKEALIWEQNYVRVFGELIIEIFNEKIKCIKKKKAISFCQAAINRGRAVTEEKIEKCVEEESRRYQKTLDSMIEEHKAAKAAGSVTELELLTIKKIYHKLVKLIHPDLNPNFAGNEKFQELWFQIVVAYNGNDLNSLQELENLVAKALEQSGQNVEKIEILDIEKKIADVEEEIKTIKETTPYQYQFLLLDPNAVAEKKKQLEEELRQYKEHANQLDQILKGMLEDGVPIIWETN